MKPLPILSALTIILLFLLVLPASAGYVWENVTVDDGGDVKEYLSLAFDTGGTPAISYQKIVAFTPTLMYARMNGGVWETESVDTGIVSTGHFNSLAFNGATPAISSYFSPAGILHYAWKEGDVWSYTIVDSTGDVGRYTSLAFNGSTPAISYFNLSNTALKYAWQEGGVWQNITVDNNGEVGGYTSLAFTGTTPAISYWDTTNTALKYAWQEGGVWQNTTVDAAGNITWYTSLAFDGGGNPAISYYESPGALKYAWMEGGVWQNTTVDSGGMVGWYNSLAFDADGNPAISYYNFNNGDLKFAWKNASGWQTAVIDAAGAGSGRCGSSLAFNGSIPAIAYWDESVDILKYATGTPVGTINVTSDPAGAAVLLDGADTGFTTPATLADVATGTHNVTVTIAGYHPGVDDTLGVVFDVTTYVDFTLTPVTTPTTPTPTPDSDGDDPMDDTAIAVAKELAAGDVATLALDPSLSPIYAIEVTTKGPVATLLVTARTAGSPTGGIPAPDGTVFRFCEVTLAKATDDQVDHAEMMFTVPLTWLEANGYAPANVVLSRWHDGAWQLLPTTFVKEEGGKAFFTATTPGFSLFAIVAVDEPVTIAVDGEETPVPTAEPTAEGAATDATVAPAAVTTGTAEPTATAEETAAPEPTETPQSPLFVFAPVAALGALLVLGKKR